ncbi:class F sortase [Pseudokineococcus sp. 5B2Z-1]|uniref:class F sortase n=1 Tax=Pseudokineococcus sp. 5B2Z-1 TaxID=3132744 RepID=UPI0030A45C54
MARSTGGDDRRAAATPRRLAAVLAACLAVAVGTPLAWALTRPPAAVGEGLPSSAPRPADGTTGATGGAMSGPQRERGAAPDPSGDAAPAVPTRWTDVARDATPAAVAARRGPAVAAPVEVRIPALDVVAPVDALGVDDDGAMALPDDVSRTAWYRWGAAPGSGAGSAVVAGHVAAADGERGVLADLAELGLDDVVEVVRADGTVLPYRVTTREAVEKTALPVAALFDEDGPERLVLVTCGGPYLRDVGAHRDNVVVVAEPL